MKKINRELIGNSILGRVINLHPSDGPLMVIPYAEADVTPTKTEENKSNKPLSKLYEKKKEKQTLTIAMVLKTEQFDLAPRAIPIKNMPDPEEFGLGSAFVGEALGDAARSEVIKEAVNLLRNAAKLNRPNYTGWHRWFAPVYRQIFKKEYHPRRRFRDIQDLGALLLGEANKINQDTRMGSGNFVIVSPEIANMLERNSHGAMSFKLAATDDEISTSSLNLREVASWAGMAIFSSALLESEEVIVGRKGQERDPGIALVYRKKTFRYDEDKLMCNFATKVVGKTGKRMYRYVRLKGNM